MAKSDRQRSLRSEEFFFDSEASLLDQHDFEMSSCTFNDVFDSRDSHTFLINVQVLLEAARFLESADRKDGSEFYCAAFDLFLILGSIKKKKSGKQDFRPSLLYQAPVLDNKHGYL